MDGPNPVPRARDNRRKFIELRCIKYHQDTDRWHDVDHTKKELTRILGMYLDLETLEFNCGVSSSFPVLFLVQTLVQNNIQVQMLPRSRHYRHQTYESKTTLASHDPPLHKLDLGDYFSAGMSVQRMDLQALVDNNNTNNNNNTTAIATSGSVPSPVILISTTLEEVARTITVHLETMSDQVLLDAVRDVVLYQHWTVTVTSGGGAGQAGGEMKIEVLMDHSKEDKDRIFDHLVLDTRNVPVQRVFGLLGQLNSKR
ncbi:hypothetical protein KI688_010574 [Linnemannia hyalina]|uniref:Uncharacterized protein n=1 Tax=Linnemannia hyalina TaxID=64524 RepID=A0A9P7XY33_9FUNG|nr:hypothetical protein KI688_010574 [Linnemannia hyalina]